MLSLSPKLGLVAAATSPLASLINCRSFASSSPRHPLALEPKSGRSGLPPLLLSPPTSRRRRPPSTHRRLAPDRPAPEHLPLPSAPNSHRRLVHDWRRPSTCRLAPDRQAPEHPPLPSSPSSHRRLAPDWRPPSTHCLALDRLAPEHPPLPSPPSTHHRLVPDRPAPEHPALPSPLSEPLQWARRRHPTAPLGPRRLAPNTSIPRNNDRLTSPLLPRRRQGPDGFPSFCPEHPCRPPSPPEMPASPPSARPALTCRRPLPLPEPSRQDGGLGSMLHDSPHLLINRRWAKI